MGLRIIDWSFENASVYMVRLKSEGTRAPYHTVAIARRARPIKAQRRQIEFKRARTGDRMPATAAVLEHESTQRSLRLNVHMLERDAKPSMTLCMGGASKITLSRACP